LTTASYNAEDDEIQIVQGTYTGNFIFVSAEKFNLTMEGGYTAGCASRYVDPTNTVIDANSVNNVFVLIGNNIVNFFIDGLTIQNGNASGNATNGGGLYIKTGEGEVTLSNNIVSENKAKDNGGGVFIEGVVTVTITDNEISGNTANIDKSSNGYGAGIYVSGSSTVTFTGNEISGNTISGGHSDYIYGAGIYVSGSSTATITDNEISGNTISGGYNSYSYGGGVFVSGSSTATITGNEISGNTSTGYSASYGGGVYVSESSTATITDNEISGNTVSSNNASYGGGVYFGESSTGTLTSNVISENTANYAGGIYFGGSSTGTLTSNVISENTATSSGGGVYFSASSEAIIINNVISANIAGSSGGGLIISQSDLTTLTNNTISNNGANYGGGVFLKLQDDTDSADIYNNIIWDNSADTQGNDLYINNDGNGNYMPSPFNLLYNDIDQSFDGTYIVLPVLIDSSNLDNLDPIFVDVGDYHLQAGSPCIDTGDNAAPSLPSTDKDGNPRIANGIVDMGAYEQSDGQTRPGTLRFSKVNYKVSEDGGTIELTVKRVDGNDGSISVDYATSDDTATAPDDYTQTTGTLNWADGNDAENTFTVDIIDNSELEGNKTFIVSGIHWPQAVPK
jgi:parallel beta-helix repeat protein